MPSPQTDDPDPPERRRFEIHGQVQGVGFRPFVFSLARRIAVGGFVRNDGHGVTIEAEGSLAQLDAFDAALRSESPPLARIDRLETTALPATGVGSDFTIDTSQRGDRVDAAVTVDVATCDDCAREMLDPADRRLRHALINCTNCGPRYTIIHRLPYDRPSTSMASFPMCAACEREYRDPLDRRFHAQPTACHDCGPKLELVDPHGCPLPGDPVDGAARMLRDGRVVAIKGLGGFHLAVRADDEDAVARLRAFKRRDAKPFALMCGNVERAAELVDLSVRGADILRSAARPIVLAPVRRPDAVASGVAGDSHRLGVMLPATPVQHQLFRLATPCAPDPLVMTSGNLSDEPLVIGNDEAVERLGSMCDAILWHDRDIVRPVDDSVIIDFGDAVPVPVRRARGFVPRAIALPALLSSQNVSSSTAVEPGLCVGGELKNTAAVVRGAEVILSQHLGDLTHPLAFEYFRKTVSDLESLFEVEPRWIAHDLHPLYLSTAYAIERAERDGLPLVGVQHHHAHAAAVLAEHGECGPAIAVVCDGVGYGTDGTIWGGEVLLADLVEFRRLARLRPLELPGGDAAAKDTRRCALALLHQAFGDEFAAHPLTERLWADPSERTLLCAMLRRGVNCATSSAAGRYFDGVAALLGLSEHNDFEAQAAMRVESLAAASGETVDVDGRLDDLFELRDDPDGDDGLRRIDLTPWIRGTIDTIAQDGGNRAVLAARFHAILGAALDAVVAEAAEKTGVRTVVLSGGVFLNRVLTESLCRRLTARGLCTLCHREVPPGDGGLALGQAAVAPARLAAGPLQQ